MNLEQKLAEIKRAVESKAAGQELELQLQSFRRIQPLRRGGDPAKPALPARRVARSIEEYVDGCLQANSHGEYFVTRQALPFGRPYGKLRISDVSAADLSPLSLLLPQGALPDATRLVYLDTETTGLAGGTGTCAFLIGLGSIEGSQFVIRQLFLRDYPEEKAMLFALTEMLASYEGVLTFNGKAFDIPLLETRYALARLRSPFARMLHLDLLHPARRLWKLRLESCQLTHLEREVLRIHRRGDVNGWEIPQIYFAYLRTGNARGLQPVFYHNSLDIITLAALTAEIARALDDGGSLDSSLDLFSLSRIFERSGARERAVGVCRRALEAGLPEWLEPRARWQLAAHHKRQRQYEQAAAIWAELARRQDEIAIQALEELAMYHEHRRYDFQAALEVVEAALARISSFAAGSRYNERFERRRLRLREKVAQRKVLS
jgi:uncharacterized protein YprB with RNaseH-like and TPR domain